jgi:hypothetical protein
MIRAMSGILALLCFTAVLRSDDSKDKPKEDKPATAPGKEYAGLVKEYDDAIQEFIKVRREAKTDEEIKKATEKYPQPENYSRRFLEVAKKYPADPIAVDALIWVASRVRDSKDGLTALELLQKEHIDDPKLAQVCQSMAYMEEPQSQQFLKTVMEKSKDHTTQGQACYGLGLQAKRRADQAIEKKEPDAGKLSKEAESLFEKVATEFGDVKSYRGTLGHAAKGELFEMRFLAVGMVAPEIEAEDIDGTKMKLSDFRGKVVLLDFWGNW